MDINMLRPPVIAIDFDGTITRQSSFVDFDERQPPREHAGEVIRMLKSQGCKIIIWTCRAEEHYPDTIKYLEKHEIPFDKFNENIDGLPFKTSNKIFADVYYDNKNLGRLVDWAKMYQLIRVEFSDWFEYLHEKKKVYK
jgi:hydroxymethylpyrimidine pyrophosphatase-like HAD family hydrolase